MLFRHERIQRTILLIPFPVLIGLVFFSLTLVFLQHAEAELPVYSTTELDVDSSILFIENAGQFDPKVRFKAQTGSEILWLTDEAIYITLLVNDPVSWVTKTGASFDSHETASAQLPPSVAPHMAPNFKISFLDSSANSKLVPFLDYEAIITFGTQAGTYLARAWRGVRIEGIYPGLDLAVFGVGDGWSWRLIGSQQSSPSDMQMEIDGADSAVPGVHSINLSFPHAGYILPLFTYSGVEPAGQVEVTDAAQEDRQIFHVALRSDREIFMSPDAQIGVTDLGQPGKILQTPSLFLVHLLAATPGTKATKSPWTAKATLT